MESKRCTFSDMVKQNKRLEKEAREFGTFKTKDFKEKEYKFINDTIGLFTNPNIVCESLRLDCLKAFSGGLSDLIFLNRAKTQFQNRIPDSIIEELMNIFFDVIKNSPEATLGELLEEYTKEKD